LGGNIQNWRLIDTDLNHPYYVTAADEALVLSQRASTGTDTNTNTLHFYRRHPPSISVGYFRNVQEDVNIELCEELGITIVRRTSAGGTIYTDEDQLIYSIITKKRLGKNVEQTFELVCNSVIEALSNLGVCAKFKPPNDLTVNGKKISGSAQVKKNNCYLIHGTLILDLNIDLIDRVIKNSKAGYTSSILSECGFIPELSKLKAELKKSFQHMFGVNIESGKFSESEILLINELIEKKYSVKSWNFKR